MTIQPWMEVKDKLMGTEPIAGGIENMVRILEFLPKIIRCKDSNLGGPFAAFGREHLDVRVADGQDGWRAPGGGGDCAKWLFPSGVNGRRRAALAKGKNNKPETYNPSNVSIDC